MGVPIAPYRSPEWVSLSLPIAPWEADYEPFGKANVTIAEVKNNLRFPGQYEDSETGLHYNYFRDYDPSTGRYIESDPIGLNGGLNTYSYANSSPIEFADPKGLAVEGSWIKPPRFNIQSVGIDGYSFVSPSFSISGYSKFIRLQGRASGFVNIDIKCRDGSEEWEIHERVSVNVEGPFDVGPNVYAIVAGFLAGPYIGVSVNIGLAGNVALQAELHYLEMAKQKAGSIISTALSRGPSYICLVGSFL